MAAGKRGGRGANKRRRHGLAAAVQALQALDSRLSNALFRHGSGVPRLVWKLFELSGDGLVWLALVVWQVMHPKTPQTVRHAWIAFLLCWAIDLVLVGLLKAIVRRSRPVYNVLNDMTVVVAVDAFSFPSGHSSRVSFVAVFAPVVLGHTQPWLCVGLAAWALATALSRAAMGRHYLSDVLAGLAIGFVTVGIATMGQYSTAGLVVTEAHSDATYAALRSLLSPSRGVNTLPIV